MLSLKGELFKNQDTRMHFDNCTYTESVLYLNLLFFSKRSMYVL